MESQPTPLGPSHKTGGFNFAVYAESAKELSLVLAGGKEIPFTKKTGKVWHYFLKTAAKKIIYKLKIKDLNDNTYEVLDPYAQGVKSSCKWGAPYHPFSFIEETPFDWEGVETPNISYENYILYEMHIRGFTQDPSSHVQHPGTYLGALEKIPYLVQLGINAVELLPLYEFNEGEIDTTNPLTGERLYNYWGYSTINFFSPMNRYAVENSAKEFKTLIRELHRNGIEVILDVVYNHTAEGNPNGPHYGYRALAEKSYYWQTESGEYFNDTGCGNTFRCTSQPGCELILSSLRHWVTKYHINGFRFDLATVLKLGGDYLVEAISEDPVLADAKLIAEPWDLMHYDVGSFFTKNTRWSEWNGKYRDAVRSFIKGDSFKKGEFAGRITGSQDLYKWGFPSSSVNFITCHDGFTLHDLVSYNEKHNEANGENNRDGLNENLSWNCGAEGLTKNRLILNLRLRQMKNFYMALLISRGIPMIFMGDEVSHTKRGNNNTWCQDNILNWFNWKEVKAHKHHLEFIKKLIRIRKENPEFTDNQFLTAEEIIWHGIKLGEPNWHSDDRFIAFTLKSKFYIAFNASSTSLKVELPAGKWNVLAYTSDELLQTVESTLDLAPYSSILLQGAGN